MTLSKKDILQHIVDSLDPDDLVERLGFTTEDLVRRFSSDIMKNLDKFDDIYDNNFEEEEQYED